MTVRVSVSVLESVCMLLYACLGACARMDVYAELSVCRGGGGGGEGGGQGGCGCVGVCVCVFMCVCICVCV